MLSERIPDVDRIAVLRANALGDLVVALPALDALRAEYPSAEITLLGKPAYGPLFDARPGPVDRFLPVPIVPGGTGLAHDANVDAFFAARRAERIDIAVQLQGGGAASNPFVTRLGAGVTVGARTPEALGLDRWVDYSAYVPEVLRCLEVVALVGARPVGLAPRLAVTAQERAAAASLLACRPRPLIGFHPGADDPRRRWSPAGFVDVGRELIRKGAAVVVIGGPDDGDVAEWIGAELGPHAMLLAGSSSLGQLIGVLAHCDLVVGNDSGPSHLARAVGTPTVTIYLIGNMAAYGPVSGHGQRIALSWRTTCPCCGAANTSSRCAHNPSFVDDVTPDEVLQQALELLEVGRRLNEATLTTTTDVTRDT